MVCSRTMFLNTLCYEIDTKTWCYSRASCSWYFVHSDFVCKSLIAVCADLLIFRDLLTFFFATFFQKEASNDHLTKGNLLKWTLLNEKQNICSVHGAVTFENTYGLSFDTQLFLQWKKVATTTYLLIAGCLINETILGRC